MPICSDLPTSLSLLQETVNDKYVTKWVINKGLSNAYLLGPPYLVVATPGNSE